MAFSKLIFINPLIMHKEDLIEQKKLLRQLLPDDGENYILYALDKGNPLSATPFKSVEDIFGSNFPNSIDQITIESRQSLPDGTTIEKNLSLFIDKKMANIRIYSDTDKDWVNKAGKNLTDFYRSKKAWYAGFRQALAPLSNAIMVISLYIVSMDWTSKHYLFTVLPIMLVLYSFTMLTLSVKGIVFPFSRISLIPKAEFVRPNYELYFLIGWGLLIIATAASLIHVLFF